MKNFNDPKLELTKLDVEDVICTSVPGETTTPGYIPDPDEGDDDTDLP